MEGLPMTLLKKYSGRTFPTFLDDFFSRDWMDWNHANFSATNTTLPAVNIKEDDDKFEIEVAAPGMKKDDFKIRLENNQLTISSEKELRNEENDDQYTRREFSYQSFSRTFAIPENIVEREKIDAKYKDGVLSISLPKQASARKQPPREIKIS
jgi:HSP20 family protein